MGQSFGNNMQTLTDWIAIIVSVTGILISSIIGFLVYLSSRQSQKAEIHREIEHSYDKLMDFRSEHPEVLAMSREWTEACFKSLYGQSAKESKPWVIYYTYVELCLGFINIVLFGKDIKILDRRAYQNHYKPLILLLLSEHYPYVNSIIQGHYLSQYIKKFISVEEAAGWSWQERHKALAES
jgi:hypothetical protein